MAKKIQKTSSLTCKTLLEDYFSIPLEKFKKLWIIAKNIDTLNSYVRFSGITEGVRCIEGAFDYASGNIAEFERDRLRREERLGKEFPKETMEGLMLEELSEYLGSAFNQSFKGKYLYGSIDKFLLDSKKLTIKKDPEAIKDYLEYQPRDPKDKFDPKRVKKVIKIYESILEGINDIDYRINKKIVPKYLPTKNKRHEKEVDEYELRRQEELRLYSIKALPISSINLKSGKLRSKTFLINSDNDRTDLTKEDYLKYWKHYFPNYKEANEWKKTDDRWEDYPVGLNKKRKEMLEKYKYEMVKEVYLWKKAGFSLEEYKDWNMREEESHLISLRNAIYYKEKGFTPKEAIERIKQGGKNRIKNFRGKELLLKSGELRSKTFLINSEFKEFSSKEKENWLKYFWNGLNVYGRKDLLEELGIEDAERYARYDWDNKWLEEIRDELLQEETLEQIRKIKQKWDYPYRTNLIRSKKRKKNQI